MLLEVLRILETSVKVNGVDMAKDFAAINAFNEVIYQIYINK